jgi:hypothetical protein
MTPYLTLLWGLNTGSSQYLINLSSDNLNNIYFSNRFSGTIDCDPTSSIYTISSIGSTNVFISKFNSSGTFQWAISYGSLLSGSNTNILSMKVGLDNSILNSGSFGTTADIDPGPNSYIIDASNGNNFVLKLGQCAITNSTVNVTSCGNYTTPSGMVYSTSGIYSDTIVNANGCDSIISINLTVNNSTFSNTSITSCGNYTSPSGNIWSTSGMYTDTLQNANGCDSIISINLTINTVDTTVTKSGFTLTANQAGATYQWYNCTTNTPISGATSQSFTATSPGWYSVLVTINGCSEMSECKQIKKFNSNVNFGMNGLFEITENRFLVYPNPFTNNINISSESQESFEICITDIRGREVFKSENEKEIPLEFLEAGMYQLTILYNETLEFHQIVKL